MKKDKKEKTWNKWTTVSVIGILISIILICFFSGLTVVCAYVGGGLLAISIILGLVFGNLGHGTGSSSSSDDTITVNGKTYVRKD